TPTPESALVSGQPVKFDFYRISSTSGGGTALSGIPHDTLSAAAIPLTIQHQVTSGSVATAPLGGWVTTNSALPSFSVGSGSATFGGALISINNISFAQATNIIINAEEELQDIVLR